MCNVIQHSTEGGSDDDDPIDGDKVDGGQNTGDQEGRDDNI